MYWSTGRVGLDNLNYVSGSPGSAGTPFGTFNPANGIHHIAYRDGDGLLHVIYSAEAPIPSTTTAR